MGSDDFILGQKIPNQAEVQASGAAHSKIKRGSPEFDFLVRNDNADIVFKDEEGTGADRMMTANLNEKVNTLASLVKREWSEIKLRVTEAWDEQDEHSGHSLHYEARAVDLTTSDKDGAKLGRLARLAVNAGFDWVWLEDPSHVHASVKK